jgi:ABC-type transport system involved in multi-copper enzyme maturation permease subunit
VTVRQFFAILKDSFREAVDGFVIYVMLGLSALLILFLASISFTPEAPADGLKRVLPRFNIIFPERGASPAPTAVPDHPQFEAADARQEPDGTVAFTLIIKPPSKDGKGSGKEEGKAEAKPDAKAEKKSEAPAEAKPDGFRHAVFAWLQPPGARLKNPFANRQGPRTSDAPELEFVLPPEATAAELRTVTDDQMVAFIKYQFATFVGLNESAMTVARKPDVREPEYRFDVKLPSVSGARGWPHQVRLLFGATGAIKGIPLGTSLHFIQDFIVNGLGAAVALILSIVITAFFIPNMLRKGAIDLLISKPIGRIQLLVFKYIGGLTFIFLITTFTIGGVWLVLAVRSGLWNPTFLLVIPVLTFTFAILYSVSTLVAVYTRSAIAAILLSLAFMFFLYLLGQTKSFFDVNKAINQVDLPDWSYSLVDLLNNSFPRYKDLDKLTGRLIVEGVMPVGDARIQGLFTDYPSWGGTVGVSLVFIGLMLGLASWRLTTRDN